MNEPSRVLSKNRLSVSCQSIFDGQASIWRRPKLSGECVAYCPFPSLRLDAASLRASLGLAPFSFSAELFSLRPKVTETT